ncbi:MAG TPA: NUDIX hydrolase [Terriglobales bacterium]|nr:NUDIX hydrolase [Terriglobales bacterium]
MASLPPLADEAPRIIPGAHPAATVTLLRDGPGRIEVLLVRRHASLAFHGGAWVFPGGRIDADDYRVAASDDPAQAARYAAMREAQEEAAVEVAPEALVLISRWVTPEGLPKRFDAWFFAAAAGEGEITVDGGEIDDYRWMQPAEALAAQGRDEIDLPPPTYMTLLTLARHDRVEPALAWLRQRPPRFFLPRMCAVEGGACTLYQGDAGYEERDADKPGPRHRLWLSKTGWRYECSPDLGLD